VKIGLVLRGRCDPDSANGPDKAVFFGAEQLAQRGHSVVIYSLVDEPEENQAVATVNNVQVRYIRVVRWRRVSRSSIYNLLLADRPDVVELHSGFTPEMAYWGLVLGKVGIRYMITPHGAYRRNALRVHRLRKLLYAWYAERRLMSRANSIRALTKDEAQDIRRLFARLRLPAPRLAIACNGIPEADTAGEYDARYWHNKWGIAEGALVFLYLGRLDVWVKGLDVLVRAFGRARKLQAMAGAYLALVGPCNSKNRRHLESCIAEAGIGQQVVMTGALFGRDKWSALRASDVFVQCSRTDAAPLSVIEALAAGRPCLVSRAASFDGIVECAGAGSVIGSESELVAKMAELADSDLRSASGRASALARERFTWNRVGDELEAAFLACGIEG
jgi:glycosyltransferase involved in cell wall biosynthesis